jgi:hypothetical protein
MSRPFPLVTGAAWAAVAVAVVYRVHTSHAAPMSGLDFDPLYEAGTALAHGSSPYGIRAFVYLPPAAFLWVPTAYLPVELVRGVYLGLLIASLVAVTAGTARLVVTGARWPLAAAVAVTAVLLSGMGSWSLWLMNLSVVLAPFALLISWLFGRGRWWWGVALLAGTLLVKPLLVPLLLIPVMARVWRPLVAVGAGAAAVLGASIAATPGAGQLQEVFVRLSGGSVLVGFRSWNNLSLAGLGEYHYLPGLLVVMSRLVVIAAVIGVCWMHLRRGRRDVPWTIALGGVLMAGIFLAGPLNEVHYLFVLVPVAGAAWVLSREWLPRVLVGAGVFLLLTPGMPWPDRGATQGWLVLAQVLLLAGTVVAMVTGEAPEPTDVEQDTAGAPTSRTRVPGSVVAHPVAGGYGAPGAVTAPGPLP